VALQADYALGRIRAAPGYGAKGARAQLFQRWQWVVLDVPAMLAGQLLQSLQVARR